MMRRVVPLAIRRDREHDAFVAAIERSKRCCRQPGSNVLGYTKTIDTGETTSTVVSLPAGRYWAYCNVDGHWQGGMVSRLTVE